MLLKGFYAGHALWPRFSLSTEERILLVTARFQSTGIVFYPHFIFIVVEYNNNTACRNLTSTALTVAVSFIFAIVCARSQVLSPLGCIIPLPNFAVLFPLSSYHSLPLLSSVLWQPPPDPPSIEQGKQNVLLRCFVSDTVHKAGKCV